MLIANSYIHRKSLLEPEESDALVINNCDNFTCLPSDYKSLTVDLVLSSQRALGGCRVWHMRRRPLVLEGQGGGGAYRMFCGVK